MTYAESLKPVLDLPDDRFPDLLFNPLLNDYEDDYYEIGISSDPLTLKARGLRKKYADFFDYIDALRIYNEYMDLLVEKYGSMSVIKNSLEVGNMPDIVPSKPKLKNNKKNRQFLKAGVIPSRQMFDITTSEELADAARVEFPDATGDDIDEMENFKKVNKKTQRALGTSFEKIASRNRRNNLYASASSAHGSEMIVEYLNQAAKGNYDDFGDPTGTNMSVAQIVEEMRRDREIPQALRDAALAPATKIVNGRLVKTAEWETIEIIKQFYDVGIDLTKGLSKTMDKKAVKMIKRSLGMTDTEPMTQKELKKFKKQSKKEAKLLEKRADHDATLSRVLLGNKVSFDKRGSSLNIRLRDLIRDDD